jgi:glycosyltransferase involved in cell wall biosynthesis
MKIAFQHLGNDWWIAGNTVLESLLAALHRLGPDRPDLALVVDPATAEGEYALLSPWVNELIRAPLVAPDAQRQSQQSLRYHLGWWFQKRVLRREPFEGFHPLEAILPAHRVDCYFSVSWTPGVLRSTPYLLWIPDFQHVRLPHLFDLEQRARRDLIFRSQARGATRVLVTSSEVQRDFEAFAPAQAAKAWLWHYVAHIPAAAYERDPMEVLAPYHVPERFVYLPNQFWRHKNHRVVFEALRLLGERGVRPVVVCTGNAQEWRSPRYMADLMQLLSLWQLREQVIYLGIVPREHVLALMRQAVCVLNPSLFEGLGLSAAESRSLGKRALLSDLPALREQDPPGALYFKPDDPVELAGQLELIWQTTHPGPDLALEAAARAQLSQRQTAFARAFLQMADEATQLWKRGLHAPAA